MLETLTNLLLVILGFSLVIFFHELGHFAAARWAKIRVHAFAVGFGPALCSFRKGLGIRLGSSEVEYHKLIDQAGGARPDAADESASNETFSAGVLRGVSSTEYRLNIIPFGGYVKMLGQEDANPGAVSFSPDSFTSKPVWKRMIVISAGVIMNVLLAGVLFVVVFMAGMREVAPIIGDVTPGSAADKAGLKPGDRIVSIDGEPAQTFTDLQIATATAGPGEPVRLIVDRATPTPQRLNIDVSPIVGGASRLMQIGVGPAASNKLFDAPKRASERQAYRDQLDQAGLVGVPEGSSLVSVNGVSVTDPQSGTLQPLLDALTALDGKPVQATFRAPGSATDITAALKPEAAFQTAEATVRAQKSPVHELLGLRPLMKVQQAQPEALAAGLKAGDLFLKVGDKIAPDIAAAINEINARAGVVIPLVVLRDGKPVKLTARVSSEGRIGFLPAEAFDQPYFSVAQGPLAQAVGPSDSPRRFARLGDQPTADFVALRAALQSLPAAAAGTCVLSIESIDLESGASAPRPETATVSLTPDERASVKSLGWTIPIELLAAFQPAQITVKASDPWHAVAMGVAKTHRVLTMTYLTFARLFQGTVKVEHLKGPVGIASLGTRFAEEGFVYLLFFLGLISANLAVVNFLPLPIVDGGLFLMLCYEGIARRPVPLKVQNAVTIAGLALIGTLFLIVTYHDVIGLFR